VLTAAIVGIAISVIVLISGGIESASEGINSELETASAVTFGGITETTKISELLASNEYNYDEAYGTILGETPNGYEFNRAIDTVTDTAIYVGTSEATGGTYSINGETVNEENYSFENAIPY
jgi:uncharacterized oligopeptide transporter (OPT) family protein